MNFMECIKTDCPNYKGCNKIPYVDNYNNVTCGIYLNYLEEKKYKELSTLEKIKNKIENILKYDKDKIITVHLSSKDSVKIDSEFTKYLIENNFKLIVEDETFIEVSYKVKV